ncbi:MAG: hypothetical protein KGI27_15380, partial [Thaumarchaeota archaeon]|nr:hypothetical protein [Nitrososphaerota archaeon]
MKIPSNNCLHHYFAINGTYNRKVMKSCGLDTLPDRRTFDRRFKVLPIGHIIGTMGQRFLKEELVERDAVAVDSAMMPCKKMWH